MLNTPILAVIQVRAISLSQNELTPSNVLVEHFDLVLTWVIIDYFLPSVNDLAFMCRYYFLLTLLYSFLLHVALIKKVFAGHSGALRAVMPMPQWLGCSPIEATGEPGGFGCCDTDWFMPNVFSFFLLALSDCCGSLSHRQDRAFNTGIKQTHSILSSVSHCLTDDSLPDHFWMRMPVDG